MSIIIVQITGQNFRKSVHSWLSSKFHPKDVMGCAVFLMSYLPLVCLHIIKKALSSIGKWNLYVYNLSYPENSCWSCISPRVHLSYNPKGICKLWPEMTTY